MRKLLRTAGGRTFARVWAGQLASNVGPAMTSFGLGIWVFLETGSATRLALIVLAARLPMLLVSPFAGVIVDRIDRRVAMIVADAGAAAGTLATVLLLATGRLEIWHLYLTLSFSGLFQAFQFPAYSAATTLLVPREDYARASGLVQLAGSIGRVVAPTAAAVIVAGGGLGILFAVDFVSFAVALATLVSVRFPAPETGAKAGRGLQSMVRESREGWEFVTERRGLLVLLVSFALVNFAFSAQSVLLIPLLLSMGSETTAGTIVSLSALGLVAGSLLTATWGGPRDRVKGVYAGILGMGVGLAMMGMRPSLLLVTVGILLVHVTHPMAGASSQAIWQSKVPPGLQGRVFAVRQMLAIAAAPAAFLLAGTLADRVFIPLLDGEGALATVLAPLVGTGDERGLGFMFVLMGALVVVTVAMAWRHPRIRSLEREVPDVEAVAQPVAA
jgi:MFS family permease